MAIGRTLSQIAASSANVALTDFLVGVHGNNDVLFSPTQIGFGSSVSSLYVDGAAGNDINNGSSPATAWKTITKVNASTFQPGQSILFAGGQTFSGAIVCPSGGTPSAPITFGSYGGGQATISSGAAAGFTSTSQAGIIVRDLTFLGSGATAVNGIIFNNALAGNVHLQNIQVIGCFVDTYGGNGIYVTGTNGYAGYDDVVIDGCAVTNCNLVGFPAQTELSLGTTAGINVASDAGFGLAANGSHPSFANVIVRNCIAYSNPGVFNLTNAGSGSGIQLGEVNQGLIQNCYALNNGASGFGANGGSVGIWLYDSINSVISSCISEGQMTGGSTDGLGFDLDTGCRSCTIMDCYSKNSTGCGYLTENSGDPLCLTNDNNKFLRCISENDGLSTSNTPSSFFIAVPSGTMTNLKVIGCTFYQSNTSSKCFQISGSGAAAVTGLIADNSFVSVGFSEGALIYNPANSTGLNFQGNQYRTYQTFLVVWNGVSYTSLADWDDGAFPQEAVQSLSLITANVEQLKARATLDCLVADNDFVQVTAHHPSLSLNDTQTNGHQWLVSASVHSTTVPYFAIYDNTAFSGNGVTAIAINYDGHYSTQTISGAVFGWSSASEYADGAAMDTAISRIAPVSSIPTIAIGNGTPADASGTIQAKTKAGAPSASDVPAGTWALIRDTTNSTTKLYYNNAGTLMTVALT